MKYTENAERIQQLREDYSRQMQESRYEAAINKLSPADRSVVETLGMLADRCGGATKLSQLMYIYQQITSKSKG